MLISWLSLDTSRCFLRGLYIQALLLCTKSIFENIIHSHIIILIIAYLVNIASASGFLPFYHGGGGNPNDDFGNGPFGGNSAVFFSEPDQPSSAYIVTILGNGTIVIADEPQSM